MKGFQKKLDEEKVITKESVSQKANDSLKTKVKGTRKKDRCGHAATLF